MLKFGVAFALCGSILAFDADPAAALAIPANPATLAYGDAPSVVTVAARGRASGRSFSRRYAVVRRTGVNRRIVVHVRPAVRPIVINRPYVPYAGYGYGNGYYPTRTGNSTSYGFPAGTGYGYGYNPAFQPARTFRAGYPAYVKTVYRPNRVAAMRRVGAAGPFGYGYAPKRVLVRPWAHRPYYGVAVNGAVLGDVTPVSAFGVPPSAPTPSLCWVWTDDSRQRGYYDYCQ
jgi:hypothetical protein